MQDRTHDGKVFRVLTVIDEFTRECLALPTARRPRHDDVLACLADLFTRHGDPDHIRSDNVLYWEVSSAIGQQVSARRIRAGATARLSHRRWTTWIRLITTSSKTHGNALILIEKMARPGRLELPTF